MPVSKGIVFTAIHTYRMSVSPNHACSSKRIIYSVCVIRIIYRLLAWPLERGMVTGEKNQEPRTKHHHPLKLVYMLVARWAYYRTGQSSKRGPKWSQHTAVHPWRFETKNHGRIDYAFRLVLKLFTFSCRKNLPIIINYYYCVLLHA